MAVPKPLKNSAGSFVGKSTLHMPWMPEGQRQETSESKLHMEFDREAAFATITYTWSYQGKEKEGLILIAGNEDGSDVTMGWSDSWHQSGGVLHLHGSVKDESVNCKGSYSVPGHPDWGWRIEFKPGKNSLAMKMFNISPEGEEGIAVDAEYTLE